MSADPVRSHAGTDVAEALAADRGRRVELAAWAHGSLGLSSTDIEDVLQETYIELLRYPAPIHNPEGFTFRVFQARCCKLHRHRQARPDTSATNVGLDCLQAPAQAIDERLAVEQGMARLTPRCRRLILAYYFEGKMPRETVREVGLSSAKVVSEITSRCLRRLRGWLQGR